MSGMLLSLLPQPFDLHTEYQSVWNTLRGMPFKVVDQEAQKDE